MFKEFKKSIYFLLRFLGFYLGLSILYSWYLHSYEVADPATLWVTNQSVWILNLMGQGTSSSLYQFEPTAIINIGERGILSVYEGCNGINVLILFLSFVIAFGKPDRSVLWFAPVGTLLIHVSNLGRIIILFFVAERFPQYMYFAHKYFFTAIIYVVVFGLWVYWVNIKRKKLAPST